jgi:hypothetical protein
LTPNLVIEALEQAMAECRPDWSDDLKLWITELVKLSLRSSVGIFEDSWYRQMKGVPTGGTLCVQLANIAVYYVMHKAVYSESTLMTNIEASKRFIDDGCEVFRGTKRMFTDWINKVNTVLAPFGLSIDECSLLSFPPWSSVSFLDIKFWFDQDGNLQIDLFIKETDARSYLFFGSSHPNHVYSGIVYSQALRLRRIINSQERLVKQLDILHDCFKDLQDCIKDVHDCYKDVNE